MTFKPDSLAIGIDIGGTKIAGVVVNGKGEVLVTRQSLTNTKQGVTAVIETIANLTLELIEAAPTPPEGIGIGAPGQVNPVEGVVRNAVNLGWDHVPLRRELLKHLSQQLPVQICHDSSASAIGERYFGSAKNVQNFIYLGIGTGLGGAVVTGGYLVTGAAWSAAELGHISIQENGMQCACGLKGCAETIISGPGLVRLYQKRLSKTEHHRRLLEELPSAESILRAAEKGDSLALDAIAEMSRALGKLMALLATTLNPALFVIGGGLGMAAFDKIKPTAVERFRQNSLPGVYQEVEVRSSTLQSSAIGAASLVWYAV